MTYLRKLIYRFRLFMLRRKLGSLKRSKKVVSYSGAGSLVILYEAGEHLGDLINVLEKEGKKVTAIGFTETSPEKEENNRYAGSGEYICSKRDFGWSMKPSTEGLRNLTEGEFDILLDLSHPACIHLKFLAALINAKFKLGARHQDFIDLFDLVLEVGDDFDAKELAGHAIHYLKIIKTKS